VRRLLALALAGLLLLAGCGGGSNDDKLDRSDQAALAAARDRLDDALDTAETLRTDPKETSRLLRLVRRDPLTDSVPNLIDSLALADFLRYARSDPAKATHRSAADAVDDIVRILDGKDTGQRIAALNKQKVSAFLKEAERDTKPVWPDLARRL
jgi:hypothetical protein